MPSSDARSIPSQLGIEPGASVAVLHAPDGFDEAVGPLPPGVDLRHRLSRSEQVDLIIGFVADRAHLERNVDWLLEALAPGGAFWVLTQEGVEGGLDARAIAEVAAAHGASAAEAVPVGADWQGTRVSPAPEV